MRFAVLMDMVLSTPFAYALRADQILFLQGSSSEKPLERFNRGIVGREGLLSLLLLFFLPVVLPAQSQTADNMGIAVIVGKQHAWMLEAPEKWILDPAGAKASGLGAAFHPADQTWSNSPAVMYANTIPKEGDSITVAHVMADDARRAESRLPKTLMKEMEPLGTIQGVDARICYFARSDSSLFEAVAYIDCPTAVALVVLSARTASDFQASLGAFARLVDSYEWITNDPSRISGTQSRKGG